MGGATRGVCHGCVARPICTIWAKQLSSGWNKARRDQVFVKLGEARFSMVVYDKNALDHRCSLFRATLAAFDV